MTFKKLTGTLHLWLGLGLGLVVLLSYLPAAVYVFEPELTDWYYAGQVFVKPENSSVQPVSRLWNVAQQAVPGHRIEGIDVWPDRDRAYVFYTFRENPKPGLTFFSEHEYWEKIYVNPYTAEVTGVVDVRTNWIELLRIAHQQLLLRYDLGHLVVGVGTLGLFVLIGTGLVLWFPRNKAALKQRFSVKWSARWRRKNYDLHNVGGFYAHLVILVLAATGLVWTFEWWEKGIFALFGETRPNYGAHVSAPPRRAAAPDPMSRALADALTRQPDFTRLYFYKTDSTREFEAYVTYDGGTGWDEADEYFYHGQTGELVAQHRQQDKTPGEKWRNSNYVIHVGSLFGWPTRILACLATLICASLPLTGFLIWWGRRKKGGRTARKAAQHLGTFRKKRAARSSSPVLRTQPDRSAR